MSFSPRPAIVFVWAVLLAVGCSQPSASDTLLQTAATGSGEARYTAIDDIGERCESPDTCVPALTAMLADNDKQVRWRAARSLGDFGAAAQSAAPQLRAMLAEDDPILQYHAAVALGKIGDKSDETVDALIVLITNPDGRVARAAIAALRNLQPDPEKAMAALENVLASNDQAVVVHAIEAAVERGEKAVPVLNAALKRPNTAYLACVVIEQIGPPAAGTLPELTELLGKTKHSKLLIQALLALAKIGPAAQSASPQIKPFLEYPNDATIPVAAAYALGSIGATDADAELQKALVSDNVFLSMVAAWALAKIHPDDAALHQQAMDKLNAGLTSDDPAIRAAAEKGLQSLQPPAAEPAPAATSE